jgi:pimeloyl-ACP methyl ester carboxylesterase
MKKELSNDKDAKKSCKPQKMKEGHMARYPKLLVLMTTLLLIGTIIHVFALKTKAYEHIVKKTEVQEEVGSESLAVILHGYTKKSKDMEHVINTLKNTEDLETFDVIAPDMPFKLFSTARPGQVIAELLLAIDNAWEKRAAEGIPYKRIIFIGHSAGGLYARKLYAAACGQNKDAPFEQDLHEALTALGAKPIGFLPEKSDKTPQHHSEKQDFSQTQNLSKKDTPDYSRAWAGSVKRIVLLAGMNRGWSISHHMSLLKAATWQIGIGLGHLISRFGDEPIIFSIRRGSPFVIQLRLQWISMRHLHKELKKSVGDATTVQLLGTIDDLVSPYDNVDHISGSDFVYLEVPESGHENVIEMDDTPQGDKRKKKLREALTIKPPFNNSVSVTDSELIIDEEVTDVVFVIHGIRDEGFWTQRIATKAKEIAKDHPKRKIASKTSSYGYFPILSFLTPGARQKKVGWLMERYVEAKVSYPNAVFHYVGHSHGTYLLAKALKDYPAVNFQNVVFAGSVVEQDYAWEKYVPQRVDRILNFVASADWVVAFFPNAFETFGWQDLGGAGYFGFVSADEIAELIQPEEYLVGGHSAAIKELMWESIANFVISGDFGFPKEVKKSKKPAWWVYYPGKVAWIILLMGAFVLGLILYLIIRWNTKKQWKKTLAIVAYVWAVFLLLTKY